MAEPDENVPADGKPCENCGFLNPSSRLYCSDCGAKLGIAPPSYLAAAPAAPSSTGPVSSGRKQAADTTKKPRILSANRRNPAAEYAWRALRYAVLIAFGILLVQLLRAPASLPPPEAPMDPATVAEIRARLGEVARRGSTANAPWSRLNAYLASVLAPAASPVSMAGSFVRAVVQPSVGGFTLTTERTLARIPLYTSVDYRIVAIDGRLALRVVRVRVGHVTLPTWLAPLAQGLAGDISSPLQADLDFLGAAKTVRLAPDGVHLDFGAPRR